MTGNTESSKRDALETVFSAMEGSCCPGSSYKPEPTPDSLDYVFENVETFTCRNEAKEPDVNYSELLSGFPSIERDNSLIIFDEQGRPVSEPISRSTKSRGEEKDALDYVFENVERYTCNEKMPDDQVTLRKAMLLPKAATKATPGQRCLHTRLKVIEEPVDEDDEIQLYFRPKRPNKEGRHRRPQTLEV